MTIHKIPQTFFYNINIPATERLKIHSIHSSLDFFFIHIILETKELSFVYNYYYIIRYTHNGIKVVMLSKKSYWVRLSYPKVGLNCGQVINVIRIRLKNLRFCVDDRSMRAKMREGSKNAKRLVWKLIVEEEEEESVFSKSFNSPIEPTKKFI